jgi:hypothetical protein
VVIQADAFTDSQHHRDRDRRRRHDEFDDGLRMALAL